MFSMMFLKFSMMFLKFSMSSSWCSSSSQCVPSRMFLIAPQFIYPISFAQSSPLLTSHIHSWAKKEALYPHIKTAILGEHLKIQFFFFFLFFWWWANQNGPSQRNQKQNLGGSPSNELERRGEYRIHKWNLPLFIIFVGVT
jgi:hypothetical protein